MKPPKYDKTKCILLISKDKEYFVVKKTITRLKGYKEAKDKFDWFNKVEGYGEYIHNELDAAFVFLDRHKFYYLNGELFFNREEHQERVKKLQIERHNKQFKNKLNKLINE